jgi:hypothetical protein
VPFDHPCVPGQGEPCDDGVGVALDACGDGVEAGEAVAPDGIESLRQPFALALGEHPGEGPHISGGGVEFVAVDQDQHGLEPQVVDVRQGLGAPEDPSGDNAG